MAYAYCSNKKELQNEGVVKNEWQNGMWVTSIVSIYIDSRMYDNTNKQTNM